MVDVDTLQRILGGDKVKRTWPEREPGSRLADGYEPLLTPKFTFGMSDSLYAIGSCFARNIEQYLKLRNVQVRSADISFPREEMFEGAVKNDLLVKFTPGAIFQELHTALEVTDIQDDQRYMVFSSSGGVHDVNLPMWAPSVTLERALERRKQIRESFRQIKACEVVIITLGLIEHWFDRSLGVYINDLPPPRLVKAQPHRFEFRVLSYEENKTFVKKSIDIIREANASIKIVMTTSPVPLHRTCTQDDVVIANAYGKSMLRVIAQEMASNYDFVDYFPSYEMITLSNPASTWKDDLRHVREEKITEVVGFFCRKYFEGRLSATSSAEKYAEALQLYGRSQWQAASTAFEPLFADFADDNVYLNAYATCSENIGLYQRAYDVAQIAFNKDSRALWMKFIMGRSAARLGRTAEAIDIFEDFARQPEWEMNALGWLIETGKISGNMALSRSSAKRVLSALQSGISANHYSNWAIENAFAVLREAVHENQFSEL
jgi:hypothetical protein